MRPHWGTTLRRASLLLVFVLVSLVAASGAASAHPLGNLSVNTFSRVVVDPDAITVDIVVDAAEIPTLQAFPNVNRDDGTVPVRERDVFETQRCQEIRDSIDINVDAVPVALDVSRTSLAFAKGSAGLHTSRLTCTLSSAPVETVNTMIVYRIAANQDRVGWREVVAVPSGVAFADSDVPATSVSSALTRYPQNLLDSPPDQRGARLSVRAGSAAGAEPIAGGPTGVLPRGVDRFTSAFTDLVARQELSVGFGLLAVLAAMALGGLHAFAPGHGKTVMAAYLVGREGSLRQAAVVGLSVTATHTLGVLVLGLALTGAGLASPERVYPWLGTVSGLLLAGIGIGLLLRHRRRPPSDAGAADHPHHHHDPADATSAAAAHRHGLFSHSHLPPARNIRGLVAVGFAGGLVPSPSALLVLLGGIALGRTWFGVLLVVAYGVGMAGTLMAAGLLMVSARDAVRRAMARRGTTETGHRLSVLVGRALPAATALVVVVVGLGIAFQSAVQI